MRRLVLSVLVVAMSIFIARFATIHPIFRGGVLADARETAAYRVDASGVRFPLNEGTRRLRVLANLDLPPGAPAEGVTFTLRIRIPEEAYDERFALLAVPRARLDGNPAVFSLGEAASPAWAREIALERTRSEAAVLEVSLVEPELGSGSLRVLAEAERAPLAADILARRLGPVERDQLASSLGPLDWDQLPANLQDELLQRYWARIPAATGSPSRRLYIAGPPAPVMRPEAPLGETIEAGQIATYILHGPGTLRLFAAGTPLLGTVELLEADGDERTAPLRLAPGDRLDLPVTAQVTSARVLVSERSQVIAVVSDRTLAYAGARLDARPDGEWVIHPAVTFERVPRAEPAPTASPIVYDLRGRASQELRVTARMSVAPDATPTPLRLRWTMRDEQSRSIVTGVLEESLSPAREDRSDEAPGMVPTTTALTYLWPPPSAATLEVTSDTGALVAVDSPGFAPPPQESKERPVTVLRHAPVERPMWVRVRPSNEDELRTSGRMVQLRSAARLERVPPPPPPAGVAETLEPLDGPPRFTLLVPTQPGAKVPERGVWWPLHREGATQVRLRSFAGASPNARVPWNLLYLGNPRAPRSSAAVKVDSTEVFRARLFTPRGILPLTPTTAGVHQVQVALGEGRASEARLFLDHPAGSDQPFHVVFVHPLRPGARSTVRLSKSAQPRSLGALLYFDGAPGERATLEVTVDAEHRTPPAARASSRRSRMSRVIAIEAEAVPGATYLDRRGPAVWATAPIFLGLGDDLAPGSHFISMVLKGTRTRAFARFFSYGGRTLNPERISAFGEFRSVQ